MKYDARKGWRGVVNGKSPINELVPSFCNGNMRKQESSSFYESIFP